jgi:TonB family protein
MSTVHEDRAVAPEHVTYIEPATFLLRRPAPATDTKSAPAKPAKAAPPEPDISAAIATIDLQLANVTLPDPAAPDLTSVIDAWVAAPDSLPSSGTDLASKLFAQVNPPNPPDGVYTADLVERSVRPRNGNPTPRYPAALQQMEIEGDFVVKFVVDTTGTVMDDRIEFPSSMHRLFADAVRSALRKSRYFPATFAGHAVPQLVIQEFRFTMRR